MRTFTVYRKNDISATHNENQVNPPDMPQYEGVIFEDGHCVLHWLTTKSSISVWACFDDAMAIHGHPEYHTEIVWNDGIVETLVSKEKVQVE